MCRLAATMASEELRPQSLARISRLTVADRALPAMARGLIVALAVALLAVPTVLLLLPAVVHVL